MRYKLTLQYDGSNYSGWQQQKNAQTVQGTLIQAVQKVVTEASGHYGELQGAGRTDAGVHAYGQVAHVEADLNLNPAEFHEALNALMPPSIHVVELKPASARFHARHHAKSRQYVYRISRSRNPFERKYVCWVKEDLDLQKMTAALHAVEGFHDFASFSRKPKKEKSTQVHLESVELATEQDLVLIRVKASHFLWNMVRNLVGAAVEVGKGTVSDTFLADALAAYNPDLKHYRMPPAGLFLEKIVY